VSNQCTCFNKAPTVPVFRDETKHLDDCPARDSGQRVGVNPAMGYPQVVEHISKLGQVSTVVQLEDYQALQQQLEDARQEAASLRNETANANLSRMELQNLARRVVEIFEPMQQKGQNGHTFELLLERAKKCLAAPGRLEFHGDSLFAQVFPNGTAEGFVTKHGLDADTSRRLLASGATGELKDAFTVALWWMAFHQDRAARFAAELRAAAVSDQVPK
jgi:hypothetical protein